MKEMRLTLLLILTTIFLAFLTGYYALFIQGSYSVSNEDIVEIQKIKRKFQQRYNPLIIINFNSLYSSREHLELIRPPSQLNTNLSLNKSLYYSNKDCFKDIYNITNSVNFEKVVLWEEFRCGKRDLLPRNFFNNPPFLHPSGKSYVYLAHLLAKYPYKSKRWLEDHFQYMHVSEFKDLEDKVDIPDFYIVLKSFGNEVLQGIIKGDSSLLNSEFYIEKNKDVFVFFDLEYKVYSAADFIQFVENTPYHIRPFKAGKKCFFKDGSLCWDYNMGHVLSLTSKHKIFLVLASLLIIILLICLLYNKLKAQRMEDNKRRLALQVLTHEFRTPVTSLVLLAEEAQKKFEKYDEESQELLLRLSSEIHRLFRLVDASRNYLNFDQGKKLVNFKPKQIKSVNEFINSVLSPYIEQVNFIGLEKDCSFYSDEYWVSICLKNLVENAINHGAKPILVKLESTDNMLKVIVEDQGVCDFDNLEELTGEFIKGSKSQGTGLGLNIVKKVLHDMKADLFFKQSPTTFTMVLREIK